MKNLCGVIVIFVLFSKNIDSFEHFFHPFHHDPDHHVREELLITNITSGDEFKLEHHVTKWTSLRMKKTCYAAGLTAERNVVIVSIKLEKKRFSQESYMIELESKPVEVELFEHWNSTQKKSEAVLVVATQKNKLQWFKLENSNYTLFWTWFLNKAITHINNFQINYNYHILIVTRLSNHTSADLYEFELEESPNFWLNQKIPLKRPSSSSALISTGPNHFLAIPQQSESLMVYELRNNRFQPFKTLYSEEITEVVAFKIGQKAFFAFNGLNAGIYHFTKNDLIQEHIANSHLDGINYWLPIPITKNEENTILFAQRSLDHGFHKSFVVEIITYDGKKFEEHEDVKCLYFGEEVLGLSCLPEANYGIRGSTSIYIDDVLGLLVPRAGNNSELFLINTEIKEIKNPIHKQVEKFVKEREVLSKLMSIQEERYDKMVANSRNVDFYESLNDKIEEMVVLINSMKSALKTTYTTIIFNEDVQIQKNGIFAEVEVNTIKGEPADEIFADIIMKNNVKTISSPKIFTDLETDKLFAGKINRIKTEDFLFTTSHNTTITGDLIFEKPLIVGNKISADLINGKILENEIVHSTTSIKELSFENVKVRGDVSVDQLDNLPLPSFTKINSLYIPHNLEVEKVNGENFNLFLQQLCLRNIENYIPGTTKIKGNVIVKNNAQSKFLNNLKFPKHYVFADSSSNITGKKYFAKTLTTSELKVDGLINNINTSQLITLSTDQSIPKKTTFKNLKITESLKVQGQVFGEAASRFLPNPTLTEDNLVKANVNFKNLTVDGKIILSENFNGENLHSLLSDIIYKDEKVAVIEAVKQFPEGFKVATDLSITSNSINDINIDSIVTKDTEQTLNITTLHGIADFDNIVVNGLYDFVDIKKLDEEIVKLNGEQYISATLIFENSITAKELEVTESINDLEQDQFVQSENQQDFNTLEAEAITVEGNMFGKIYGFDLDDFNKKRLSLSKDQDIRTNYNIEELSVENLEAEKLNNTDFHEFTLNSFEEKLKTGKLKVKDLYVEGPLKIDRINDRSTINLGGSLWKNDIKKFNITELNFQEDTFFNTIEIEKLSKVDFKEFIHSLVFKNETNPKINGVKTFLKGISVDNLVETKKLNNISLPNLLTRQGVQEVEGSLTIHGNVSFDNTVKISQLLNGILADILTKNYKEKNGEYEIRGEVLFDRLHHIYNLKLEGFVNDKSAKETTDGIIYKDKDFKLAGNTTFKNDVLIEKNIIVNKTNNIDLAAFVSTVVMTTKDTEIQSSVRFAQVVTVEEGITVSNNLETKLLNGVNLDTWPEKAIFINKGFSQGTYNFEQVEIVDNLQTDYLNDIDMTTLIPLRTRQNISKLSFEEIATFKNIQVGNSTNSKDLKSEFAKTVFTNFEQDIDSEVEFLGNIFIEEDIELAGLLNDMEADKIVTTNTDQELTAAYNFRSKVTLQKNLLVEDFLNGINITKWMSERVKVRSSTGENITDNWLIRGELIFEDDVNGSGLINGLDLKKFRQEVEDKRNDKYAIERGFIDDYSNICKDLTYMYEKVKKQIYKFNYLENLQELHFKNGIQHVYHFNNRNNFYLLINEVKSCESHLFNFRGEEFRFVKSLHLGIITQIISVRDNGLTYFVINSESLRFCDAEGTNIWQLFEDDFSHLLKLENQDLLQESLIPATFYGLRGHSVIEFKILPDLEPRLRKYRKWEVKEDNMAFVPRGLSTGLALRTGRKLIKLNRDDPIVEDFNHNVEEVIIGNFTEEFNAHLPGRKPSELIEMKVAGKKTLLAVASHEETSVKGSLDFIKIYEDVINGRIFHKIPTYKPSSLVVLDFNNGETLLTFMEDERVLQVYEYKGIEGFKHKLAVKVEGSMLMSLSPEVDGNKKTILGLVNRNRISFMEAIMLGNKIDNDLYCHL